MNTAKLHSGAEVEVDIRGRKGKARLIAGVDVPPGRLAIEPLSKGIAGYGSVTARQVRKVLAPAEQLQIRGSS